MRSILLLTLATTAFLGVGASASNAAEPNVLSGRAKGYEALAPESLESVTPREAILRIANDNISPGKIWQLLEHGEKVECLRCIPVVARRLYDPNAKTREISAWWLRRRVFGVFGPGQVYSRVVATLNDRAQPEHRRSYAADALGEFLNPSGVPHVARAALQDPSPRVRQASVAALARLNTEGPELELGRALADSDENVRMAALEAAMSINVFSSVEEVVARVGDASPRVRRRAAEALGALHASDAVVALVALASAEERDADVRQAAVWALGEIGDPAGRLAVESAKGDQSALVRTTAQIAARRL